MYTYICIYIYTFFIFFSIMVYHRIVNIVRSAIQQDLVVYPFYICQFASTNPKLPFNYSLPTCPPFFPSVLQSCCLLGFLSTCDQGFPPVCCLGGQAHDFCSFYNCLANHSRKTVPHLEKAESQKNPPEFLLVEILPCCHLTSCVMIPRSSAVSSLLFPKEECHTLSSSPPPL